MKTKEPESLMILALFVSSPLKFLVCKKAALLTDSLVILKSDEKISNQLFSFNLIILMETYSENNTINQVYQLLCSAKTHPSFSPTPSFITVFLFMIKQKSIIFPKKSQYSVQIHFWWPKQLDAFSL